MVPEAGPLASSAIRARSPQLLVRIGKARGAGKVTGVLELFDGS